MTGPLPLPSRGTPLKYLVPGWYTVVMGLAGLSLAWWGAAPILGEAASIAALAIGAAAAVVFVALTIAAALRGRRYPGAWAEDLEHPVRQHFVAAVPIALILLVTCAVAAGLSGPLVRTLWWVGSVAQLFVTAWVLSRWWHGSQSGGLQWTGVTPALFIPIVGNVLVPLAGIPLGQPEWAAAQFGVGLLFWPVVTALLAVRIATQGMWPERLLPASFIFIAPPAAVGLSALQFGASHAVGWGLWGMALFSVLWVAPLTRRIADQAFGLAHWGMTFPLAAFAALTLRLAPSGPLSMAGIALLALTSLLVAAFLLATVRGLLDGRLLAAEPAAGGAPGSAAR